MNTKSDDTAIRLNELIIAINETASDIKRIQIMAQDVLLRSRIDDPELELDYDNVSPITDANR